jgi:predicted nucleic-acid-binding protein
MVEAALEVFIEFRLVDFPDCLIAVTNAEADCETTYTFDKDASGLDQFTLLRTKA